MTILTALQLALVMALVGYCAFYYFSMKSRIAREGPEKVFHESWAVYFDDLPADETIVEIWHGERYAGPLNGSEMTMGDRAGRLAATVGAAAIGIGLEYFRALIYVARTSQGRILLSEEYAENGSRGNFRQVAAFEQPKALSAMEAHGRAAEAPPTNQTNPSMRFEFIELRGRHDELPFALWATVSLASLSGAGRTLAAACQEQRA